jgi:hypothetical protein
MCQQCIRQQCIRQPNLTGSSCAAPGGPVRNAAPAVPLQIRNVWRLALAKRLA